jgi:predicted kinase
MPKLVITCGTSGSGKSTYAQSLVKQGWVNIERDKIRFDEYCNGMEDWRLYKFNKAREDKVSAIALGQWCSAVYEHKNVIVSDTNLKKKYHDYWKQRAEIAGYEFEVVYFDITLEEAYKRDTHRGGKAVGRDVLNRQWKDWLEITEAKKYVPDETKPRTIVSDVDGTVAKMVSRGPFDWKKVGEDAPRWKIIHLVESLALTGNYELVFVSGRDGSCYEETKKWLDDYIRLPFTLYMREAGDMRKDTIIKEEILFNQLADRYNIEYWFDDRNSVVRKLKDLGINVIDVSEGYEEF